MYKEIWLEIVGFEGRYEVSNLGRVRNMVNGRVRSLQQDKNGYWRITLKDLDSKKRSKLVHRLMATTFIPNPKNYPILNHIDGDSSNCLLNNLEWCNHSHNIQHAYDLGLRVGAFTGVLGKDNPSSKKVNQYDLEGNFVRGWDCVGDVTRELNYSQGNISSVARGERYKAHGFIWKYV